MLGFITDTVAGGWDAVTNITSSVGRGMAEIGSSFFPAPQRATVISETVEPAGGSGQTYRPTITENQSMFETLDMMANNWLNSPYEERFSVPAKQKESRQLAGTVSGMTQPSQRISDTLADIFGRVKGTLTEATKVKTVVEEFAYQWGLTDRPPVYEGPTEIGNSPGTVTYQSDNRQPGPQLIEQIKTWGQGIAEQVKGLYNLAFPQNRPQPAFGVTHELKPSAGLSAGMIIAGIILLAVIFLGKKR